jgi:ornithine cyclodeaminase/alanine dehydrogenase-like protein (mu-crystallin family)
MERQSTKAGDVPVLFDEDVERLADMRDLVAAMKDVLREQRAEKLVSPPRHYVEVPAGKMVFTIGGTPKYGGFRMYNMFGRVRHTQQFLAAAHPDAKPERRQVVVVFDMETNQLQGVIIGDHLSAYRAGSIAGAAMDIMAPREMKTLAILGTGHHATTQLLASTAVRRFAEIRVYSRSSDNRRRFVEAMSKRIGQPIRDCDSAEAAVRGAEAVVSATNSGTPVYDAAWVSEGAYVCSVGPKSDKASEIPAALAARAAVICTDTPSQFAAFRDAHVLSGTKDFDRVRPLNEWLEPPAELENARGIRLFLMEGLAGTEVVTGACLLKAARRA